MEQQSSNKKLEWIITKYGNSRINQLLAPNDNLNTNRIRISSMDIGSSSTGTADDRDSKGCLQKKVNAKPIPVIEKGIATDRENTVYFKVLIDENMCGYSISEFALYEDAPDGTRQMFAVGVGAPLFKPSVELGYLMTVEYTIYIESVNLLEVYDKIELDPANEFLKEVDIDNLYKAMLYIEGNMAEQIGNNTRILGMSRIKELNQMIEDTKLKYHSASVCNYYSSLSNSIKDLNNLLGFWSFHYTDSQGLSSTIKDFSTYSNNLSTDLLLSTYEQEYLGTLSSLKFEGSGSYSTPPILQAEALSTEIEIGHVLDPTVVGKCLYDTNINQWLMPDNITTYSEDYFKTNLCTYYLRATHANVTYANPESTTNTLVIPLYPTKVLDDVTNEEITVDRPKIGIGAYAVHTWVYDKPNNKWVSETEVSYEPDKFKREIVYYEGTPKDEDTITMYAKRTDFVSFDDNLNKTPKGSESIIFTGKQFNLIDWYKDSKSGAYLPIDSPFTFLMILKHNELNKRNTLLAQSDYFLGKHNFEIVKTEKNGIEVTLFSTHEDNYVKFKTIDYVVPSSIYSLIITYNPNYKNGYDNMEESVVKIIINGKTYGVTKEYSTKGTYTGMKNNMIDTTSYLPILNEQNIRTKGYNIDSQVCLIGLIKEELDLATVRCNALVLNSLCGKNVYYKV